MLHTKYHAAELPKISYAAFRGRTSKNRLPWHGYDRTASPMVRVVLEKLSFANIEQPIRSLEERWMSYVRSLADRQLATVGVAFATEQLWQRLRTAVPAITRPNASPTDELGLSMSWNRGRHYLEIEVHPSGEYDWFYRDRTGRVSDRQRAQPVEAAPTDKLKTHLKTMFE
jgi:hypothetical protein